MRPFTNAGLQRPILSGSPFLPWVLAIVFSIQAASAPSQFEGGVDYEVSLYPYALAVVDANGDLRPDLVTANYLGNDVSVLLGQSAGGFRNFLPRSGTET